MATDIYSDGSASYGAHYESRADDSTDRGYHDRAGMAFLWVAWTLAFAFWAFSMTTFFGIMRAIAQGGPGSIRGGVDMSGSAYLLMDVIGGVIVLGIALAWGMAQYVTRDKSRDAFTEAATAALYDEVERAGGDDEVSRSPDARRPRDRDSYRSA